MKVDPTGGTSNFSKPVTTPPANTPKSDGLVPANDNLKYENVQVIVNTTLPQYAQTPSGSKTIVNYVA